MESLINIKSLENFKSYFLVNVFPFRFVANKNLEILLYRRQNTEEFQAFSDYRSKLDPTTFFTAARILYQSIHNEKIILDAKVLKFPVFS